MSLVRLVRLPLLIAVLAVGLLVPTAGAQRSTRPIAGPPAKSRFAHTVTKSSARSAFAASMPTFFALPDPSLVAAYSFDNEPLCTFETYTDYSLQASERSGGVVDLQLARLIGAAYGAKLESELFQGPGTGNRIRGPAVTLKHKNAAGRDGIVEGRILCTRVFKDDQPSRFY